MWRNLKFRYIYQISPHLPCIDIWNFSTWQIFLHMSQMWTLWQIWGMFLLCLLTTCHWPFTVYQKANSKAQIEQCRFQFSYKKNNRIYSWVELFVLKLLVIRADMLITAMKMHENIHNYVIDQRLFFVFSLIGKKPR